MNNFKFNGEFSWEIIEHIPKVYEAHLNKALNKSVGCCKTKPFYFFTNKHEEILEGRQSGGGSNSLYDYNYDISSNKFPQYKEYYSLLAQKIGISFDKPLVIINNKSVEEWGRSTNINRIEIEDLSAIVDFHKNFYIFYIRGEVGSSFPDNTSNIKFEDKEFMSNFKNVYTDKFLEKEWGLDFNTTQLICHSLSEKHFSVAGGNAVLASLFGGKNFIFGNSEEVKNRLVWHTDSYLSKISNTKIIGVEKTTDLEKTLNEYK